MTTASADAYAAFTNVVQFTGESLDNLNDFISAVDTISTSLKLANNQTAQIAKTKFQANSAAGHWLCIQEFEKEYQNLDLWNEEEGKEGGLKAALKDQFKFREDFTVVANKFRDHPMKVGETFNAFRFRLKKNHYNKDQLAYTETFRASEAYKPVHEANVRFDIWVNLRPGIREALDSAKAKIDTYANLCEAVLAFEQTDAGQREQKFGLKNNNNRQGQQSVVVNALHSEPTAGANNSSSNSKVICDYCGIPSHHFQDCFRRKKDVDEGIVRDRHPDYPCKSRKQLRKEKEKSKEKRRDNRGANANAAQGQAPAPPPAAGSPAPASNPVVPPPGFQLNSLQGQHLLQQLAAPQIPSAHPHQGAQYFPSPQIHPEWLQHLQQPHLQ